MWTDTFSNYFQPHIAQATVNVLESAGFRVIVPRTPLCCGRPLYDYGMLGLAKRLLRRAMSELEPLIGNGTPMVGIEPSCVAVFRDELVNLFPGDPRARQLRAQTFVLSELLEKKAPSFQPPRMPRRAVVHGHCHQRAVIGIGTEESMFRRMGLEYQLLDSGCCGMAGSFGFEKEHYDVSVAAGERVLLPAVRAAADDTLLVANGFSCREQIAQTTGKRAYHLAEVIDMGLGVGT